MVKKKPKNLIEFFVISGYMISKQRLQDQR